MKSRLDPTALRIRLILLSVVLSLVSLAYLCMQLPDTLYVSDTNVVEVINIEASSNGDGEPLASLVLSFASLLLTALLLVADAPVSWALTCNGAAKRLYFSTHVRPRDPPLPA
ncbi:hypothetical protein [Methylobacillus flagellatus]|uniref:Uncharacterized protein n=1 Tax=Methylobacillus flagellatus (strain ATCC 51484 / DSM 6875 / VKM B-1610 / KT) TaxID=265072 RepID=Q1H4E1_METFK|nr:hypothetical protein [Methylobacillus flagellatus]ABE48646.1 hypothetical protein Mfla_0375 [Methylobacillus flagellatus KT]